MNQHVNVKARIDAEKRKARANGMKWARKRFYDVLNEFGALFLKKEKQVQNILQMHKHASFDFIEGALAYLSRKIKGYGFAADYTCPLYTVTATYHG